MQNRNGPRPEGTLYIIDGTSEVSSRKDCATGYFHQVNNVSVTKHMLTYYLSICVRNYVTTCKMSEIKRKCVIFYRNIT